MISLTGVTSPTSGSPNASGWRAKQARACLSGLKIVNLLHIHIYWIYKIDINEQKHLKKNACMSQLPLTYPPTRSALIIALENRVLPLVH